ncbi:SDR family oxidoreductase [Chitinophaga sp.]|uniref:SDR family NAD(P)-dependent oxidoreductase n=1 Tax=Chitinophaga sp. TaxID=1869181 RepID=UPI0025BDB0DE|nr:SDR family oxidoreductase [Chitinophaga sp.]
MLLKDKVSIIYGAGGAVGRTIAETFAREGSKVFLTGRNRSNVEIVAKKINAAGGYADVSEVDALDERAISKHLDAVLAKEGHVDISFNAVGLRNTMLQGVPLIDLPTDQFMAPILSHVQSNFLSARVIGRHMIEQGSGVLMNVTSSPSRVAIPHMGGVAIAMAAEEALIRDLSAELGPRGVRVVGLRPHGMVDSETIQEVYGLHAKANNITREQFQKIIEGRTHLKRLPTLQEMAEVAAFMASDRASAMTGTIVNLSMGVIAD